MTNNEQADSALAALDRTVQSVLAYFEGPGLTSKVRITNWGIWEILCHFIFWHEVTIEGMESAARGSGPYRLDAQADVLNERALIKYKGNSIPQLVAHLREMEKRLLNTARNMPDLDAPVLVRMNGMAFSGRQRLEMISSQWANHMTEIQKSPSQKTF